MGIAVQKPVIARALGTDWDRLAPVVRRHYDLMPGQDTRCTCEGVMLEVHHATILKPFLWIGRLIGALIPYRGTNVPTTVRNWTTQTRDAMFWYRTFRFPEKPPIVFRSRMEHVGHDEIVEFVRFGIGIRMRLSVVNGELRFDDRGYVLKLGSLLLPLPLRWLLGTAVITERAVNDTTLSLDFDIHHPLVGRTFAYRGTFTLYADNT